MQSDDEPDEGGFTPPLPPEDRLWRHPSELGPPGPPSPPTAPTATTHPGGRAGTRTVAVALVAALLGAGATLVTLGLTGALDQERPPTAVEQVQISVPRDPDASDLALGQGAYPAVARVESTSAAGTTTGTAVVFRSDGHLLTTADAVDGTDTIVVTFADGTALPGELVGVDRANDVAVLRVDQADLATAMLGADDAVGLGDRLVALSAGEGWPAQQVVGVGVVSGLGQRVETGASALHGMIQANIGVEHDATGAALVARDGTVVGLVTRRGVPEAKKAAGRALEVRYATPISWAKHLADEILTEGAPSPVWLGVEGTDASDAEVEEMGRGGAKVTNVVDGSPADVAGLEPGDLVTEIDGGAVTSMSELIVALRPHDDGDVVTLSYRREGEPDPTHAQAQLAGKPGG